MEEKKLGSGYNPTKALTISIHPSTHELEGLDILKNTHALALLKALKVKFSKQFYQLVESTNEDLEISSDMIAAKLTNIALIVGKEQADRYNNALLLCDEAALATGNKSERQHIKYNIFHNVSYDMKSCTRVVCIADVLPKAWSIDNANHSQVSSYFDLDIEKNVGRWKGKEAATKPQEESLFKDDVDYFDYDLSRLNCISDEIRKSCMPNAHHLMKLAAFLGGKDNVYSGKILQELCNLDDRVWSSVSPQNTRFTKIGNQPCAFALQVLNSGALCYDRILQTERCAIRFFVNNK